MTRWIVSLRRKRVPGRRVGPRLRVGTSLTSSLVWAGFVLVLVPRQLGLPLLVVAQGLPDIAYVLLISGLLALGWGIVRTAWALRVLHGANGRCTTDPAGQALPVASGS